MPQYPAVIDPTSLNGANGFKFVDPFDYGGLGVVLASAGDINGDGFADVLLGTSLAGAIDHIQVVFGRGAGFAASLGPGDLNGTNGFLSSGLSSAAGAGDINGDGFDDLIQGQPGYGGGRDGPPPRGAAVVTFGKAGGFSRYAAADLKVLPLAIQENFGASVASAGDVNGDGVGDFIVGAPGAAAHGAGSGAAYVVLGKSGQYLPTLDLGHLAGVEAFKINGAAGAAGVAVGAAGDVNGDGFDDLLVGAPSDGSTRGAAYVVFGKAGGFSTVELSGLTGADGFKLTGAVGDRAGGRVASVGDLNGDGYGDVFVEAGAAAGGGAGYVVFGKASGFSANTDLSALTGADGFKVAGVASGAAAGDVNGDGLDDAIFGGRYVVFGKTSPFAATLDTAGLDGSNGFTISGALTLGAGAGDVNGDGLDDLVVGTDASHAFAPGVSYVVFGRLPDAAVTRTGSGLSQTLVGGAFDDALNGLGGDDLLLGGGGADSLDGGSGSDTAVYLGAAAAVTVSLAVSGPQATGGDGADQLTAIENLTGSSFADTLTGDGGPNLLQGMGGADTIAGGGGADVLEGGAGNDSLTGGAGGDTFRFVRGGGQDIITDFAAGDVIDLSAYFAAGLYPTAIDQGSDALISFATGDSILVKGVHAGDVAAFLGKGSSAYPAILALPSLNGVNGFRISGQAVNEQLGVSAANAGDINGDGFDDFVVGAASLSRAYVVFGKAGGLPADTNVASLNGANGFRIVGDSTWNTFLGASVAGAGDVNGDGFADVLVSGQMQSSGAASSFVVFGKASGFGANLDPASLDGTNGFKILSGARPIYPRVAAVSTGDVNGDGYTDIVAGSVDGGEGAFVLYGKASGFAAVVDPAALDGVNGFRIAGAQPVNGRGVTVATADVNGDGFDDVVVGAPIADRVDPKPMRTDYPGAAYVVLGKASGIPASVNVAALDGSNGFKLSGEAIQSMAGLQVSSAGDVNGDGFADLMVRASSFAYGAGVGVVYVVFGKAAGFTASQSLGALNGSNGFAIHSQGMATAMGDLNGDGFDDIAITGARYGRAQVLFGRASGFTAEADISDLAGDAGFDLVTTGILAAAGDVNRDGVDDLFVGDRFASPHGNNSGQLSLLYGLQPSGALVGDDGPNTLTGGPGDDEISGKGGADILSGLGGDDLLNGGPGNDVINGGDGTDTATYVDAAAGVAVNIGLSAAQATGGSGSDQLLSIENLIGSAYADTFKGNAGANLLEGRGGDDVLDGGPGADVLKGGAGNDAYYLDLVADQVVEAPGEGADTVYIGLTYTLPANVENLVLRYTGNAGGFGNDLDNQITGNTGDNLLDGRRGQDALTGGAGNDTFKFASILDTTVAAPDLITDFTSGDRIDLHLMDADLATSGDQAFHLGATPNHTGDLVLSYDAAHTRTVLQLYVDADANPDATIWLSGNHTAAGAGDFVF